MGLSKPRFPISHVDVTNKLRIESKKLNGLLRRKGGFGTPSTSSILGIVGSNAPGGGINGGINAGGTSANSTNVLVKRLNPVPHTVDTTDGVAIGWCPNGVRTQFLIVDSDVTNWSVVTGNVVYLIAGDNYSVASKVIVTLINYIQGSYSGFLVDCSVPPINGEALNYAVMNPSTQQLGDIISNESTQFLYGPGSHNPNDFLYNRDWYFSNDPFIDPTLHTQLCPFQITGDVSPGQVISSIGCVTNLGDSSHNMRVQFAVFQSGGTFTQPRTLIAQSEVITVKDDGLWHDAKIAAIVPQQNGAGGTLGHTWLAFQQEFKSVDTLVYIGYVTTFIGEFANTAGWGGGNFATPRYDVFTELGDNVQLRYKSQFTDIPIIGV